MMFEVKLNSIELVKRFVKIANNLPDEIEIYVRNGKYTVDGRSIMGIFSLDLTKVLTVEVDEKYAECFDDMKLLKL